MNKPIVDPAATAGPSGPLAHAPVEGIDVVHPRNGLPDHAGDDMYSAADHADELDEIARSLDPGRDDAPREVMLAVDGVHCAACAFSIERAIGQDVRELDINIASRRARIVWEPSRTPLSSLLRRIAALGYTPRPVPLDALVAVDLKARRSALWRMLAALLCSMQVMMYAYPRYIAADRMEPDSLRLLLWAEAMLTVPVLLFAVGPFVQGAVREWRARTVGMDTPIVLGIAITTIASVAGMARGEDVWFDSITMFVALLLVARWLESRARDQAAIGLASTLGRLPTLVTRETGTQADTALERVSRRRLRPGDIVHVPVGDTVPVDGELLDGPTEVDESVLTGESRPVPRATGEPLRSGSLNLGRPLRMRVLRASMDSTLSAVHQLIERASATRPRTLQLADRWAGRFLVAVLLLALVTGLVWWMIDPRRAPWIAASVLIVTCPCALALAAPSALLAGMGALARRGVLVRSMETLETLATIDTVVLDKTGTLTHSEARIAEVTIEAGDDAALGATDGAALGATDKTALGATDGAALGAAANPRIWSPPLALQVAASLERQALHPVARAILAAAAAEQRDPLPSRALALRKGGGIEGEVLVDSVWRAARIGPEGEQIRLDVEGLGVARMTMVESLREDAPSAIDALRTQELRLRIASGDAQARVATIAARCAIDDADAGQDPAAKQALVHGLQQSGHRVLMVGDGVNDAPVLEQADVSASLVSGAALARHRAGILLLSDRLMLLPLAVHAARRSMRIVRQGLAASVLYNLIALPLAVTGQLSPWLAGIGMAMSSLVVVLNALRARSLPETMACRTP